MKITLLFLFLLTLNITYSQWKMTDGPGNNVVSVIYYDGNELYVSSGSGNFYTSDDGNSWELLNKNGPLDLWVTASIIKQGNKLFVGTSKGVFLTEDYGKHWELVNEGFVKNANNIIQLKIINEEVYALSSFHLYKFDDDHKNWTVINDSVVKKYNGGFNTIINKGNIILIGSNRQKSLNKKPNIIKSNDGGKTWNIAFDTLHPLVNYDIKCFAIKDDMIMVGTDNGIYISTDNGENWVRKNDEFKREVTCIHVKDSLIFIGTKMAMYNSNDGLETIKLTTYGISGYITTIQTYKGKIFAGTSYGLFRSTNNGNSWEPFNKGLCGGIVYDIAEERGRIFAATYGEDLFISNNKAETWQHLRGKYDNSSFSRIVVKDSNIFAGFYNTGIICSNNNGISWRTIKDTNGLKNQRINCFEKDGDKVLAGTWQGIFMTNDFGYKWVSLYDDLLNYQIVNIKISGNSIFVGTNKNGIFKSTDYGNSWYQYSTSFTQVSITDFEIIDSTIFASTFNSQDALNPIPWKGVFKSTDWGKSWFQANNGLPEIGINCLISINNTIFAGTDGGGIYMSSDFGSSWEKVNSGLISYHINKLLVYENEILAATSGGVFKAPLSDFGIINVEEQTETKNYLYCYPPYPNPSANIVRSLIYWDTSIDIENDDISVYDIYGNKVAGKEQITIDKQNQYSGLLTWNCSNVPDGIYLIRLIHGTETRTMKVIVSK